MYNKYRMKELWVENNLSYPINVGFAVLSGALLLYTQTSHLKSGHNACINVGGSINQLIN